MYVFVCVYITNIINSLPDLGNCFIRHLFCVRHFDRRHNYCSCHLVLRYYECLFRQVMAVDIAYSRNDAIFEQHPSYATLHFYVCRQRKKERVLW